MIKQAVDNEHLINQYESLASDLMQWIKSKIEILKDRTLSNSLIGVQQQLVEFNTYRIQEKPPKYVLCKASMKISITALV